MSEVASVGGFEKQYQVLVDPVKLLAFNIPLGDVKTAVERSNVNVGGRVIEWSEREYAVQGLGYLGSLTDEEIAAARAAGKSLEEARTEKVLADLRKIAAGRVGRRARRSTCATWPTSAWARRCGAASSTGTAEGEAVGGIVVMRFGENARTTIEKVRERLADGRAGPAARRRHRGRLRPQRPHRPGRRHAAPTR